MGLAAFSTARKSALRPQTCVIFGDSLSEQGGMLENGTTPGIRPNSYWTHANTLLGWRFRVLRNAGIFGQSTTQILARIEQDVISLNPGWVWLLAGTNDVGLTSGTIQSKTIPNLTRMLDRFEQADIRVVWLTIPPRTGDRYIGNVLNDVLTLNEWIRAEARRRPNVILADIWEALGASGSGNYATTVYGHSPTSDGLHMSGTGGFVAGQVVANAVAPATIPRNPFSYATAQKGLNLLQDPNFLTGTGTAAPTGWNTSGFPAGATWSKTARADDPVPWQTVTLPSGTSIAYGLQGNGTSDRSLRNAAALVGRKVIGTVEFQATNLDQAAPDSGQGIFISVGYYNGATFSHNYAMQDVSGPNAARSGRFVTSAGIVPAGTTAIALFVWMVGGGTYSFAKAGLFVADQSGIAAP